MTRPQAAASSRAPDGSYLLGYWQTEKYFKDIRHILLKEFSFNTDVAGANKKTSSEINVSHAVSLHVRRGDYVTNQSASQFHGTKGLDYYEKAISYIAERVKDPHFFVFSDDPKWCQEHLAIPHSTTYVTNNSGDKGYEDMRLMSQCQHHIIANSSFSWWGAWLNPSDTKIVIAPQVWFNDTSIDTSDIYAEGWVKL